MSVYPTGDQYEITYGDQVAVVTEIGATLRAYRVGNRDVVRGFAADAAVSGGRGQQLIPWPNRIRDGRYSFDGVDQQLWLTEPARHNASHGLVRYVAWSLLEHATAAVRQRIRVLPQPGWPGSLEVTLAHSLSDGGLRVDVEARNLGDISVPFGYGAHPYFTVGEDVVDEVALTVPADSYLEVDPERLLPIATHRVEGTEFDLRDGAPLGPRNLDTAMTGLRRDPDGRWRIRLERGDAFAELWAGAGLDWTQIFTGGPYRDRAIAAEPMTCGPDAFNPGPTHDGLIVLAPDEVFSCQWGVTGR